MISSLTFCLVLIELTLRLAGINPMADLAEGRGLILRESDHPLRVFELTPNSSGTAWRTQVEINSHGMRDREYPIERSAAPRIVVLGDSVAFGSAVAAEEVFTERLEEMLAEKLHRPVEVLNLAVGGYDTLQEVATLEQVGTRFSPDLVVLAYCINDIGDYSPNLAYIHALEGADARLYKLRTAQLVRTSLDRLHLIRRLRSGNREELFAERFRDQISPVAGDHQLRQLRKELEQEIGDSEQLPLKWYLSDAHLGKVDYALGWLRALEQRHGFEVLVAILPYLGESEGYGIVYRLVAHMAERHGFESIELASAFPGDMERFRANQIDTIHPNPEGHRLIAEALAPVVAEKAARAAATIDADAAAEMR